MRLFLFAILFLYCKGEPENFPDLNVLLNDPEELFKLEKRLGSLLADLESEAQPDSPPVPCTALSGVLDNGCEFQATDSKIIKTKESLDRNAKYLQDHGNVSCARDCTALCCAHEGCDTAIYQNKDEHICYLFMCGSPSKCVFADHADYWMSSVSRDVHSTHSLAPGGATITHENELQRLGSDRADQQPDTTVQPATEKPTTTVKPGLGDNCASYSTKCNDTHAECLMGICECRSGYHEKHGVCRKRCRDEEFECERIQPGVAARQCVHKTFVCDGSQDCADGSDEFSCADKDKADTGPHISRPIVPEPPQEPPQKPPIATQVPAATEKVMTTTPQPQPIKPEPPVLPQHTDNSQQESGSSSTLDNSGSVNSKTADNQSKDKPTKGNNSVETGSEGSEKLSFMKLEPVEVDSYTDSSQGPIVALSLGLAITVLLLIFVGCRLRTVKRRLRKGRVLHSNEADYLINGMYL